MLLQENEYKSLFDRIHRPAFLHTAAAMKQVSISDLSRAQVPQIWIDLAADMGPPEAHMATHMLTDLGPVSLDVSKFH